MWKKDERTEAFLRDLGVDFDYLENLPMEELHPKWDKINTSRDLKGTAIIQDTAIDYGARMDAGESPPAVICSLEPSGKLFPRDGRQRLFGARHIGWSTFSAFVVETKNSVSLQLIELGANNRINGSAPSNKSFAITRAAKLHIDSRMSVKEISRAIGVSDSSVEQELIRIRVAVKLTEIGLPAEVYKKGQLLQLNRIMDWKDHAPRGFRRFCQIVLDAKLENGLVEKYAIRIAGLKKKSGESQLKSINRDLEQEPMVARRLRGRGSGRREPIENVCIQLDCVKTAIIKAKKAKAHASEFEEKKIVELFAEINRQLRFLVSQGAVG